METVVWGRFLGISFWFCSVEMTGFDTPDVSIQLLVVYHACGFSGLDFITDVRSYLFSAVIYLFLVSSDSVFQGAFPFLRDL